MRMLEIKVPQVEIFDSNTNTFANLKSTTFRFEHSLIAISKWEQKWHKSLLKGLELGNLSDDAFLDYIRCMSLDSRVTLEDIELRSNDDFLKQIVDYLNDPASATILYNMEPENKSHETVTSEVIYCWLAMCRIPFDPCEKWNINRVLKLLDVYNLKTNPPKKMSPSEILKWQQKENERRKRELNTRG